jgi:hypothetical protein
MNHVREWNSVVIWVQMEVCNVGGFHIMMELVVEEEDLGPLWESGTA